MLNVSIHIPHYELTYHKNKQGALYVMLLK